MNEHISTSNHSYVIAYGMSREPFGDKIEDDLFYAEPTRKQKLDILLHLTQYGNELMLVTGPSGSGKTTLLQQFQLHALDTWKVARIEAKNGIDERKLVQQLFHQMNLEFHGATHAELLEHLEHHFDSLQRSARQAVMLIDDAEQLPVTALKAVLALAGLTSKDNKPLLRIVLFGNDKLEEKFSDPLLTQHNNVVRRAVDLPAFDSEHTAHYILHRLSAAHFSENKPFTDAAMQKIHKQAHGWPAEINRLAHNLLIESALASASNASKGEKSSFNVSRAIAAVVGATMIGALLFFQEDFNTWLDSGTNNTPDVAQQSLTTQPLEIPQQDPLDSTAAPDAPATTTNNAEPDASQNLPADDPAAILAQMYGEKEPANDTTAAILAVDEIPESENAPDFEPVTKAAAEQISTAAPRTVATGKLAPTSPDTPSVTEPAATPVATKAKATPTVTPAATKAIKPVQPTIAAKKATSPKAPSHKIPADLPGHRTDWILKQNPEHFTLQLVAGNDIKTLRAFIKRHPLTKPLAVYRSTRKGKPWFGLIHGIFPSKQQAINARSRLSKALRRDKPWVRNLAPLQKELR